jgi:transcriptional regulator with XRE-family HTH domain
MDALPFCHASPSRLSAPKATDVEPQTLGEHIRKRRLELRLSQKEVARRLGRSWRTVFNWENRKTRPAIESMPTIIGFLGYDHFPESASLSGRLAALRREKGWTIKQAAEHLGVDEGTWSRWEKTGVPWKRHQAIVQTFLEQLSTGPAGPRH